MRGVFVGARRQFGVAILLWAGLPGAGAAPAQEAAARRPPACPAPDAPRSRSEAQGSTPNIVFILVDDLRWNALGCTGHPFVRTPHIDRLAKEGALFRNAFVTTPLCSPSRASFLTGQYVRTHGIRDNGDNGPRSHQLVTFPRLLHDSGYETGYVGKWHMGHDGSPRPGFDRWVSFEGQGQHVDPTLNLDGEARPVQGYLTDILTDYSVEFLRRPRTRPFCLYLGYGAVHGPFVPAERHQTLYSDRPIPRTPNARDKNEGKPALNRPIDNEPTPGPGRRKRDETIRNQLRMLAAIDEGLGKILDALTENCRLDDTMVVFTSDNGFFWGEHGLGDKRWAYEESIRIPLLVRLPGQVRAGTRIDAMALNVDIAPTFLELAGSARPRDMQGESLLPLLRGQGTSRRESVLLEYFMEPRYRRAPTWQAVRTERWKLIRYPQLAGADELYDLREDPGEMENRLADPAAAATLKHLRAELDRLLLETNASDSNPEPN